MYWDGAQTFRDENSKDDSLTEVTVAKVVLMARSTMSERTLNPVGLGKSVRFANADESNLLALKTSKLPTVLLKEMKPISSNLIFTDSHQYGQPPFQGDRTETTATENVNHMMDYSLNPFLRAYVASMDGYCIMNLLH
jgi:hypothetical protein